MAALPRCILPFAFLLLYVHMAAAQPHYQKSARPIQCVTEEYEFYKYSGDRIVERIRHVDEVKQFDNKGRLILKRRPPDLELVFTYNEESGVVEGVSYNNGQLIRKCIYKHDLSGPKVGSYVDENLYVIPPAIMQTHPYDGFGNILEKCVYDEEGELIYFTQFSYRTKYVKEKNTVFDNDQVKNVYENERINTFWSRNLDDYSNNSFWNHSVINDNKGRAREHVFTVEGDDVWEVRFVYDENHRRRDCYKKGVHSFNSSHREFSTHSAVLLDERGQIMELLEYENDGPAQSIYRYKRDEQGHVIERTDFSKGVVSGLNTYTYDDKGNEIFKRYIYYKNAFNQSDMKSDTEKKYDSVGNCIEEAYYEWETKDGKPFRKLMNRKLWTYAYY